MQVNPKYIAINKLSILYMLRCAAIELRENQLIRLVADHEVMEYFELMRTLAELEEDKFIDITPSIGGNLIAINELGQTTLDFFKKELSYTWRQKMEAFFEENRSALSLESKLYYDYHRIGEGQYRLTMRILERNFPIFEVMMICSSKEEADRFARGWQKNALDVYAKTVTSIVKNIEF